MHSTEDFGIEYTSFYLWQSTVQTLFTLRLDFFPSILFSAELKRLASQDKRKLQKRGYSWFPFERSFGNIDNNFHPSDNHRPVSNINLALFWSKPRFLKVIKKSLVINISRSVLMSDFINIKFYSAFSKRKNVSVMYNWFQYSKHHCYIPKNILKDFNSVDILIGYFSVKCFWNNLIIIFHSKYSSAKKKSLNIFKHYYSFRSEI